jgi:hypothetical protein
MYRSPFANFRQPHELLCLAARMLPATTATTTTSSSSSSSLPTQFSQRGALSRSGNDNDIANHFVDLSSDNENEIMASFGKSYSGPNSVGYRRRSESRSESPPWDRLDDNDPNSVPLLSATVSGGSHHHECPDEQNDYWIGGRSMDRLWGQGGMLGNWLWNTQHGWTAYIGFLLILYGGMSLALLVMNRFILLSMYLLMFLFFLPERY